LTASDLDVLACLEAYWTVHLCVAAADGVFLVEVDVELGVAGIVAFEVEYDLVVAEFWRSLMVTLE